MSDLGGLLALTWVGIVGIAFLVCCYVDSRIANAQDQLDRVEQKLDAMLGKRKEQGA